MMDYKIAHLYADQIKWDALGPYSFYGRKLVRRGNGKWKVVGSKLLTKIFNRQLGF